MLDWRRGKAQGSPRVSKKSASDNTFRFGILENLILVQRSPQNLPGRDYGPGYFGVRNKGGNDERSLVSELEKNRRHAMLSMLILLVQEFITTTPNKTYPEMI
jgi:hypothetical protein